MIRCTVDPRYPEPGPIRQAAAVLADGGIVAYPTETTYGLAVDPRNDRAIRTLFGAKARDGSKPVALIAGDARQAEEAGTFGLLERRLAAAWWPGPLTIVVPASPATSRLLVSDRQTIGVRVSSHAVASALASAFGSCITATSANLSGHAASVSGAEVAAALQERVDCLLDGGPAPGGPPSTVVEIADGRAVLHRAGAIAWDRVLESLR